MSYLLVLAILGLTYAFYFTSFRTHVEEYFFDLKTKIKPKIDNIENIVIVEINNKTIDALGKERAQDPQLFIDTLRIIQNSNPSVTAPLVLENYIPYKGSPAQKISGMCARDSKCIIGTLNYHSKVPSLLELPEVFAAIPSKLAGVDTMKFRSNSVVRDLPYWGYQEDDAVFMLPAAIANKLGYKRSHQSKLFYSVNFWPKASFRRIQAEALGASKVAASLKDKVVMLGYSEFKPWLYGTSEQVSVNTPLVGSDLNTYKTGENILFLTANGVDNLINDRHLRKAPTFVNIGQALLYIGLLLWVWRFGAIVAPIASLGAFMATLVFQAGLMTYFNLIMPTADIFVILVATVLGGVGVNLRESIEKFAHLGVEIESKKMVANLQSRFLDDFAIELKSLNDSIKDDIESTDISDDAPEIIKSVYQKTIQCCQDFSAYLLGVAQFAAIDNKKVRKPKSEEFELEPLLKEVIRRFDGMIDDRKMRVDLDYDVTRKIKTSPQIIDTIFFNLLSNAIKYSPDGTTVYIEAYLSHHKLVISVRDEGPGIADEFKEKIFDRFYRIKNDSVYRVKGTGIGLCLCQYFANLIDAEIVLESIVNEGSTFRLEVPQ